MCACVCFIPFLASHSFFFFFFFFIVLFITVFFCCRTEYIFGGCPSGKLTRIKRSIRLNSKSVFFPSLYNSTWFILYIFLNVHLSLVRILIYILNIVKKQKKK